VKVVIPAPVREGGDPLTTAVCFVEAQVQKRQINLSRVTIVLEIVQNLQIPLLKILQVIEDRVAVHLKDVWLSC
jgi:hypothetical protein